MRTPFPILLFCMICMTFLCSFDTSLPDIPEERPASVAHFTDDDLQADGLVLSLKISREEALERGISNEEYDSAFAQEATANLICRVYYLNSMTGPTYVFEQMAAPSAEHLSLQLGDGSEADEPEWVDGYVIYRNLPIGPALFSFDWTDSEKEEIKALGVKHYLASFSDALLLSPGDNYYFKRVYYIDEDVPERIETDGDYLLLPKGLMNVWDERKKGPTPIIDDLARDALVNAPGCGVSADGGYYLVNRKTLDCQVIGGSLLFRIKPEYQE